MPNLRDILLARRRAGRVDLGTIAPVDVPPRVIDELVVPSHVMDPMTVQVGQDHRQLDPITIAVGEDFHQVDPMTVAVGEPVDERTLEPMTIRVPDRVPQRRRLAELLALRRAGGV